MLLCKRPAKRQRNCTFGAIGLVGAVGLMVEYRTRERLRVRLSQFTASNLERVANLLCARANSALYSQQDRK